MCADTRICCADTSGVQETVGSRIRSIALTKALREGRPQPSQKALAGQLGVSYETLRKWIRGDTAPNRARAAAVAELLGCQIEEFMHGVNFGDGPDEEAPALPPDEAALLQAFRALPIDHPARARVLAYAQGAADSLGESGGASSDRTMQRIAA